MLGNFALSLLVALAQFVKVVFFGSLREAEVERLAERGKDAVMETCLALTIFREELNTWSIAMFACLGAAKAFHWLAQDRAEHLQTVAPSSRTSHARILTFICLLACADASVLAHGVQHIARNGPSVTVLFMFEFFVLFVSISTAAAKYGINAVDSASEGSWDRRGDWAFGVDLTSDLLHLLTYSSFFVVVCMHYGLPLHLLRDLYWSYKTLRNRVEDFMKYKRAATLLNQRFVEPTEEQLQASDRVCIVCRDEMDLSSGQSFKPKRLPCGHMFHLACLRSWFERQQTCPTCRSSALSSEESQQRQQHEQQQQPHHAPGGHHEELQDAQAEQQQQQNDIDDAAPRNDADPRRRLREILRQNRGVRQQEQEQARVPLFQEQGEQNANNEDARQAVHHRLRQELERLEHLIGQYDDEQQQMRQMRRQQHQQEQAHQEQEERNGNIQAAQVVPVVLPMAGEQQQRQSHSQGSSQAVTQAEHEMATAAATAAAAATKRSLMRRRVARGQQPSAHAIARFENGETHSLNGTEATANQNTQTTSMSLAATSTQAAANGEGKVSARGASDASDGSIAQAADADTRAEGQHASQEEQWVTMMGEMSATTAQMRSEIRTMRSELNHVKSAMLSLRRQLLELKGRSQPQADRREEASEHGHGVSASDGEEHHSQPGSD